MGMEVVDGEWGRGQEASNTEQGVGHLGGRGTRSETQTRRLTVKDLGRIKLVWIARFRDRYFGADLEERRAGGEVADAARHDHQELCVRGRDEGIIRRAWFGRGRERKEERGASLGRARF